MTPDPPRRRLVAATALLLGSLAFAGVSIVRALESAPPAGSDQSGRSAPPRADRPWATPMDEAYRKAALGRVDFPPHDRPAARPAAQAGLADDEPVIGVRVAGRARAYRTAALAGPRNHVVNDVVGGRPVTVTYCDRDGCVRVFTGKGREPLDMRAGGYDDGLLLLVAGRRYRQASAAPAAGTDGEPFPYTPTEFVRTTWKEWREGHPDTDVVTDPAGGAAGN